jgi:hypothetical protein
MKLKTFISKETAIINAPLDKVFPLPCPVQEYYWIEAWKCELIHCPNGKNEEGVIFYEIMSSPFLTGKVGKKTKWTTLLYDTVNHKIHFKWENYISESIFKVEFDIINEATTQCEFFLEYNIINEKGMKAIKENTQYNIDFMIAGLLNMLKYYSENGTCFKSSKSPELKDFLKTLTFKEKLVFIGNRIKMGLTNDKNRKLFLNGEKVSVVS